MFKLTSSITSSHGLCLSSLTIAERVKLILDCRDSIMTETGADILENQNYNTFNLSAVMEVFDPTFCVSIIKRNGADYTTISDFGEITHGEMKSAKIKKVKSKAKVQWGFHALAVLANPPEEQFVLYAQHLGNPLRIYDVRDPQKTSIINEYLMEKSTNWFEAVAAKQKNGKFDMINLPEKLVSNLFVDSPVFTISDGGVSKYDASSLFNGSVPSIYSDYLK